MTVFWEHGYEATSTNDLIRAMAIGRQSMYDAFGDKHQLYLESFRLYEADSASAFTEIASRATSPLATIREHLLSVATGTSFERSRGCFYVNATTELASSDSDVGERIQSITARCLGGYEKLLVEAKRLGEISSQVDVRDAANFLLNTLRGLQVSAKAGTSPDDLRGIALMAISTLTPR
ncbi:TetR/AcrR family transcriptional regulator [Singulisphaera sp. PoT]|uniref:TetR/AcrR family transcriptional regulator n=1 Tax=Singulisphaera sp. PoT TaxID=3411797 RepID=UPI003BF47FD9